MNIRFRDIPGYIVIGGIAALISLTALLYLTVPGLMSAIGTRNRPCVNYGDYLCWSESGLEWHWEPPLPQWVVASFLDRGSDPEYQRSVLAQNQREAADKGDINAQYRTGKIYADGDGVKQDYAESLFWYDLAIRASPSPPPSFVQERDAVEHHLTPEEIALVEKAVNDWKPAVAPQAR